MADQLTTQRYNDLTQINNLPIQTVKEPRFKDVTIKVSKIGNGYQVTELSSGVPFAYFELGLPDWPGLSKPTTVAEHLSAFFAKLEVDIG